MTEGVINLDYESFSELNLKTHGSAKYAEHPSTEIMIAQWSIDGSKKIRGWSYGQPLEFLDPLRKSIKSGRIVRAYNALFEMLMTNGVGVDKLELPPIQQGQIDDTMALVAMVGYPLSLEGAAIAVGAAEKKDKEGARLIRKFSIPRKPSKKNPKTRLLPEDDPVDWQNFVEYCKQDVRTEMAVRDALPIDRLPAFEREVWKAHVAVNLRGFAIDPILCRGAAKVSAQSQSLLRKRLFDLTDGEVDSPTKVKKLKEWLASNGVKVKTFDKSKINDILLGLEKKKTPAKFIEAINIRMESGSTTAKKFTALTSYACADLRVRNVILYGGAQATLRWAGRGVQPHNFARPKADDSSLVGVVSQGKMKSVLLFNKNPLDVLKNVVRHAIVARKNYRLVVSDLAAIEARTIGWLANDQTFLDVFRRGEDIYIYTATIIFGCRYDDVDDFMRFVGKQAVLGLGYGMGWQKFQITCYGYGQTLDDELCKRTVSAYRSNYSGIPAFWKAIEKAAIMCVKTGRKTQCGILTFAMVDHWLTMKLPSGRRLWYPYAEVKQIEKFGRICDALFYSSNVESVWKKSTWGGTLAENADQAISRDLIAHDIVECEKAGLPVVIHVHDEIGSEIHKSKAEKALVKLDNILRTPPSWGEGLPLSSKGYISPFYKKD